MSVQTCGHVRYLTNSTEGEADQLWTYPRVYKTTNDHYGETIRPCARKSRLGAWDTSYTQIAHRRWISTLVALQFVTTSNGQEIHGRAHAAIMYDMRDERESREQTVPIGHFGVGSERLQTEIRASCEIATRTRNLRARRERETNYEEQTINRRDHSTELPRYAS